MKKVTFLLTCAACMLAFCLSGLNVNAQCPDMTHPISKDDVKKYSKNYKILVAFHSQFAMGNINLSKEELECILKMTDKIKLTAASYSAFNAKTLIAIVEIKSQGNTAYYDLDELFPPGKNGKKHMSPAK